MTGRGCAAFHAAIPEEPQRLGTADQFVAINRHRRVIAEAVAAGDGDNAEHEMRDHLAYLRPYYERAWRSAERVVARA